MNKVKKIERFGRLQRLITIFQRVNQLSWTSDQSRKRYPTPEMMSEEEIDALTRLLLSLGFDLEDVYKRWKKEYLEYKKDEQ